MNEDSVNDIPCIKVHKLSPAAILPRRATPDAAALDVYACLPPDTVCTLAPGKRMTIPTGLQLAIPRGYYLSVRPRSGLALKQGLGLPNAPGTIDADYRGELQILVCNMDTQKNIVIEHGQRIAQILLEKIISFVWEEIDKPLVPTATLRGSGGFGSTGLV